MPVTVTAPIVEWDDEKGYGFVRAGTQRVFLHRRDFAECRKAPAVGDVVRFEMGADSLGRSCANQAVHVGVPAARRPARRPLGRSGRETGGLLSAPAVLTLAGLLVCPVLAIVLLPPGFYWVKFYAPVISVIAFFIYAQDKGRAQNGGWRVPEKTLHFLELAGGWPGAFLAQRILRHKISKLSYQATFWLIVLAYQFAAIDFLVDWRMSHGVASGFQELEKSVRQKFR